MFLCFGAKKKKKKKAGTFNGNLQSLEEPFPNVPELSDWHSVWTTVFTAACCSLGFPDCSSDREETGPAELPVWTRQVQTRLETAEPQPVECTLNKCRRVKVKKEGNVTDVTCRTTSVPGRKVPSTYASMERGGRSKLCFRRDEKESGCFPNVMASLACWRHHFYFLLRIQKLSRYR